MEMTQSLSDRLGIFKTLLKHVLMQVGPKPYTVDLGCGHCLFLKAAAEQGCNVVGVDARMDRVPQEVLESGFLEERVQDVELDEYDLILCLGVFYHMTLADQLELVDKFKGKPVILDTHYCFNERQTRVDARGEAYVGFIYKEGNSTTSAVGNKESFWPTEAELVRMVGKNHFVMKWLPEHYKGRSFFFLIPKEGIQYASDRDIVSKVEVPEADGGITAAGSGRTVHRRRGKRSGNNEVDTSERGRVADVPEQSGGGLSEDGGDQEVCD